MRIADIAYLKHHDSAIGRALEMYTREIWRLLRQADYPQESRPCERCGCLYDVLLSHNAYSPAWCVPCLLEVLALPEMSVEQAARAGIAYDQTRQAFYERDHPGDCPAPWLLPDWDPDKATPGLEWS